MTFHSLSIFCHGRVLSLTQLHTLQHRQELLFDCSILNYFKILSRYVLIEKSYQASWSISIDLDDQCVSSFTEVFLWKTPFKHSFMLFRKFYIISDQQYVFHIYLSKRLYSHSLSCKYWRKYALEAIIKLLFISLYHDKCLLFMLELY